MLSWSIIPVTINEVECLEMIFIKKRMGDCCERIFSKARYSNKSNLKWIEEKLEIVCDFSGDLLYRLDKAIDLIELKNDSRKTLYYNHL